MSLVWHTVSAYSCWLHAHWAGLHHFHSPPASPRPVRGPPRRGEALARRLCGVESAKPSVDMEDDAMAGRLMGLVLGGAEEVGHDFK
jgi:hypothetical protein